MTHPSVKALAPRQILSERGAAGVSSSLVSSLPSARTVVLCGSSVLNTKRGRFDPPFPPSLAPQPVRLLSRKGALAQRGESDGREGCGSDVPAPHLPLCLA